MIWFVYLLYETTVDIPSCGRSGSRDTYVGMTDDVFSRVARHNAGEVISTRGRRWKLRAYIGLPTKGMAAAVERWLKCGNTREKRIRLAACGLDREGISVGAKEIVDSVRLWSKRHPALRNHMEAIY